MSSRDAAQANAEFREVQSNAAFAVSLAEKLTWSLKEAAFMCGVSAETFSKWVRRGLMPQPWKGTSRYSALHVRRALTDMPRRVQKTDEFEEWSRNHAKG